VKRACLVAVTTLVLACSSPAAAPDGGPLPDTSLVDAGPCGPGVYPCGPYGTQVGQVSAELRFSGFADADHLCKAPSALKADLTARRELAFGDWHRGAAVCPGKAWKVLWVMVSAGWCASCKTEVASVQDKLSKDELDGRVALLNVLYETTKLKQPADEAFLRTWAQAYGLTFPVVLDPGFQMGAHFSRDAAPFNLLLDVATMKVLYRRTGSDLPGIEAAIKAALGSP
jgi:hypothetical protein